jgi:hypothetical protein
MSNNKIIVPKEIIKRTIKTLNTLIMQQSFNLADELDDFFLTTPKEPLDYLDDLLSSDGLLRMKQINIVKQYKQILEELHENL